jgi:hypothetical protein
MRGQRKLGVRVVSVVLAALLGWASTAVACAANTQHLKLNLSRRLLAGPDHVTATASWSGEECPDEILWVWGNGHSRRSLDKTKCEDRGARTLRYQATNFFGAQREYKVWVYLFKDGKELSRTTDAVYLGVTP